MMQKVSGDIVHANAETIFVQLNHVEVVATDFTRRLPGSGDLNSGKLRQPAGQQHMLNLGASLEFFLLLHLRDGPFLDRLLPLLITFSQLSLEFFPSKHDNVTDHRDDADEITDPGEEKRERLATNVGQLQEENRGPGADRPKMSWIGKSATRFHGNGRATYRRRPGNWRETRRLPTVRLAIMMTNSEARWLIEARKI